MSSIQSYKELIVWQKSMDLVEMIFNLTKSFPQSEMYGLSSQMRRAAVSIPSNIAEGFGRNSQREYAQFYAIAYGSSLELETQLLIIERVGYNDDLSQPTTLLAEIQKMLNHMVYKAKQKKSRTNP